MKKLNKLVCALGGLAGLVLALARCDRKPRSEASHAEPAAAAATAIATENTVATASASEGPAAELQTITADALAVEIRSRARKGTLVSAWASWCGPCRRELPMLQALSVNLKPQGVDVVLVSVDEAKDEAKALAFLKDNGITLRSYRASGDLGDFKRGLYPGWPGMLPASFLFDAAARFVHFWGGEAFEQEITPVIDDFLAGRTIEPETRFGLAPGKVE